MPSFHVTQSEYSEKVKRSSLITISVVAFLIIIKLIAYFFTGSIIILSVLADSIFDLIISLTSLVKYCNWSYDSIPYHDISISQISN